MAYKKELMNEDKLVDTAVELINIQSKEFDERCQTPGIEFELN